MNPEIQFAGIKSVSFGVNCKVISPVNLYGCTFGDNCFVGPFTEIQSHVSIAGSCKIQSHCFICEGVTIGSHCFLGHGVIFVNDLFSDGRPAGGDKTKWMTCFIGNRVSIGSNATILPVTICDDVVIGAGAVVTKSISQPGIYAGNPAKLIRSL